MARTSIYRQLTKKHRAFHLFTQLFLGPDHLLLVRSNRFEERYQRFYFKDVQALVVTGLPSRTWLQATLGVLAASMVLLAFTLIPYFAWRIVVFVIAMIPALIALIDFLRGERCQMVLKTPVSNEQLPPVSRMSVAKLVIARLQPAVETTQQGAWSAGMTPESTAVMAPAPLVAAPADRLLVAVLALISLNAVVYLAARLTGQNQVLLLLFYTVLTEIVLALTALGRRGNDPRWMLYSLSGVIAVCSVVDIIAGVGMAGYFFSVIADDQKLGTNNTLKFLQLTYPRLFMWWGFGWRALIASVGWGSYWIDRRSAPSPL